MGERPTLNADQMQAVVRIEEFLTGPDRCFILEGSAGTGKTTLIAALADRLNEAHFRFCLLAPTGRAAEYSNAPPIMKPKPFTARFIHSKR